MDKLRIQISHSGGESVRIFECWIDAPAESVAVAVSAGINAFDEAFRRGLEQLRADAPEENANNASRAA